MNIISDDVVKIIDEISLVLTPDVLEEYQIWIRINTIVGMSSRIRMIKAFEYILMRWKFYKLPLHSAFKAHHRFVLTIHS